MPRVIHFDLRGEDTERAIKFYTHVFGWKFNKWEGPMDYWLIDTGPEDESGINGGLTKREKPEENTVLTLDVSSADEYAAKVVEAGGKIITPKSPIPGVGYFVTCLDTEGNVFGIMESDTEAE